MQVYKCRFATLTRFAIVNEDVNEGMWKREEGL